MCTHNNKDNEWYIYLRNKDTMSQSLPQPHWWNDPRMCAHNKDNEWYIYLHVRNKDTMSKACPNLTGGMTQECAFIIRIMNGTSTYVTRTPCHKACPNLTGRMTQECALIMDNE